MKIQEIHLEIHKLQNFKAIIVILNKNKSLKICVKISFCVLPDVTRAFDLAIISNQGISIGFFSTKYTFMIVDKTLLGLTRVISTARWQHMDLQKYILSMVLLSFSSFVGWHLQLHPTFVTLVSVSPLNKNICTWTFSVPI